MNANPSYGRVRRTVHWVPVGTGLALTLFAGSGCRREAVPPARASAEDGVGTVASTVVPDSYEGPLDTVRRIHQYRREGRVAAIAPYLVPQQRAAIIEQILSVDELTSASESLKVRVNRVVGAGSASAFDRTAIANTIGPFSRDLECISEAISGDTAVVRICVDGRLPLEDVHLTRGDAHWLIQTDPPVPGLPAELRKLARVLNRVADEVERRHLTAEQIEGELALRQRPVLERIDQLVRSAQTEETPPPR